MAGYVVIEELHVTVTIARKLPDPACAVIRRVLGSRRFRANLDRAVRNVVHRHPALAQVRVTISR